MSALTFDTLKYANTLKNAGFSQEQAEAQAGALSEVLEINLKDLVTKEHLDARLRELELRMTVKFGVMAVAIIGVLTAVIKL
jgi:hypothetical protein